MSGLKEKRIEDYKTTQLFPINIIEQNKKKNLSLSLNLFKICRHIPKSEMGYMKKLQKEIEKESVSHLLYKKSFKDLSSEEFDDVKKLLNKRASTPSRNSPYVKFLVKSFIMTCLTEYSFSSFEEEVDESWCFLLGGQKYDITINQHKIEENCLFFDCHQILDAAGLLKENCIKYIANTLPFICESAKVNEINECLNKTRKQLISVYDLKEEVSQLELVIEPTQQSNSKVS